MAAQEIAKWVGRVEKMARPWRVAALVVVHGLIFAGAFLLAFGVRFDFAIPAEYGPALWAMLPVAVGSKLLLFGVLKMYRGWWRYVSLYDVIGLAYALALALVALVAVDWTLGLSPGLPRSIYFLDFGLSLMCLAGARGTLRLVREALSAHAAGPRPRNLLIVGAGDLGDLLVREISRAERLRYRPVAFLDDHAHKQGLRLHGIPVEGPLDRLAQVVAARQIEEIIIAVDDDDAHLVRGVVEQARRCHIQPKILPAVEPVADDVPLRRVRQVSITDLLGREPVELDLAALGRFIEDRTVLITGAGGSIGAELCRQVLRFGPRQLVMVDCAETPLFEIHRQLRERGPGRLVPRIADVSDRLRMERLFGTCRPQVVLHAAAYKHVPLMEANPAEAVKNNVGGTRVVADLSAAYGVETFVLISTDKAVNPTSVMGATKRITELYVQRLADRFEDTRFCAVRFGNVLGSNGSVVPIFQRQIAQGGPVTVTHPKMTRYFMTIPEAVQLVLQAAAFDDGDDRLFILDMGQPVRIADLARDMIRLSGMSEDQIPIEYTGIRPGEKLYEELTLDAEKVDRTAHKKIFVGRQTAPAGPAFERHLDALCQAASQGDERQVLGLLKTLIPGYDAPANEGPIIDFGAARAAR